MIDTFGAFALFCFFVNTKALTENKDCGKIQWISEIFNEFHC